MHHRHGPWTRTTTALTALTLLAGACSSSGSEEVDLGEVDAQATSPPEADGDDADDGVAADLGPPDYPELPLDPDADSDIPIEIQEDFLELHRQYWQVTQEALHTGEFDPDRLALVMHGELLDTAIASFEAQQEAGYVARGPDTDVAWTRVTNVDDDGTAIVEHCLRIGPRSQNIDVTTGEPVDERLTDDVLPVHYEVVYELVPIGDATDFRATVVTTTQQHEQCDA